MNYDEVYKEKGEYLRGDDLGNKTWPLTIASWEKVNFDEGVKVVVSFEETDKTLVLNKTNADRIASQHGRDMDAWVGKTCNYAAERVEFGGKIYNSIRVQMESPELATPDDEIPF